MVSCILGSPTYMSEDTDIHVDKPLDRQLQSDKPKLTSGGKAVHTGMDTKYKSAGVQSPRFSINPNRSYKMLSSRRETALQGAL